MSVSGSGRMTLGQLSYQQRQTLRGLKWIGGIGRRLEIAEAAGLDGTQVANSLTILRKDGAVAQTEGIKWALTDVGSFLLATDTARAADSDEPKSAVHPSPKLPSPVETPPAPVPEPASFRQALDAELRRLAQNPAPAEFSADDAAWLCAAMRDQFSGMPAISAMFGQMTAYWERVNADKT